MNTLLLETTHDHPLIIQLLEDHCLDGDVGLLWWSSCADSYTRGTLYSCPYLKYKLLKDFNITVLKVYITVPKDHMSRTIYSFSCKSEDDYIKLSVMFA